MPNVAPFLPDRGVAHGMCGGTELYSQRVCFEGLRLASVKWDKKSVLSSQTPNSGSINPRHSHIIKINLRVLQPDHNISFILIMHHALALTPKPCPKSYEQLEDQGSGQAALNLILGLYQVTNTSKREKCAVFCSLTSGHHSSELIFLEKLSCD